ncbi:MdtA/MuxA family multidrug efflux RND transporter periplasmic adaptor subunit [Orrella sp. NBD-18]|uniref:MdtA/MuxA family multidrug efflux RND transporter periplasmic adaptor subunit n=1 Tax=Sheuella amnicola TaxID=2707330 RepID=A0A6B2R3E3_9BURK|nr:MdtA/MuxA family multidrug efflux RND transporter periplasmic adaptor subunit [Sheuella amnicola]NDY84224.1 MdtA/MuxA family multidrug efflux RND transporter periplasmic adaptor subunit [Sheuella amnicola]HBI83834.1 multidrug transporter subunit MdtA [Alcaligenaceae bacterium]
MFDREVAGRLLRSRPVWVVTALLLAGAAWWFSGDSKRPAQKGPAAGMAQMVPVRVEVARIEDLDIYLKGLGTVTAFNTVTVRSRVQGELISVRFKEGEQVKAGELLAEIDPRSFEVALSQAIGMQQQNQAQYENAKRDLDRYRTLRKQDSIAPMLLDTQQALVRKLEGQLKSDQAAVDNARLQLDYTRITAPISGRLGLRKVDAGNLVIANDPQGVVVITQTQPISVLFTLAETDLPAVRSAMQEDQKLPVDAYDRSDLNRLAVGTLVTVDNQIDATTGTVKLKAQFANENDALFPNQFVNVRMKVRTDKDALTVPVGSLQQGNQGAFLYVIQPDGTAAVRQVKVGARSGDRVAILDGVKQGDQVVLEGTDRLRSGAKVRIVRSDAPESEAKKTGSGK